MPDPPATPYQEAHLAEALATDPRVAELGIVVRMDGDAVFLEGMVSTGDRRTAVEEFVRERLPEARIENLIVVNELGPSQEPELL